MLKILCKSCFGLSQAISAQFNLKICTEANNHDKFAKKTFIHGRSRSSMLIH